MKAPLVIYSDASVSHKLSPVQRAGWGAVLVRGGKVVGEAKGELAVPIETTVAELKAVRLALDHALELGLCLGSVIVASDCQTVETYLSRNNNTRGISPKNKAQRKELADLAEGILRVAERAEVSIVATWVKGHAPASTHGPHNCRADKLAKQAAGFRSSDEELSARRKKADERNREAMRIRSAELKAERHRAHLERQRAERAAAVAKYGEDSTSASRSKARRAVRAEGKL